MMPTPTLPFLVKGEGKLDITYATHFGCFADGKIL
jgi:hypothetical protein